MGRPRKGLSDSHLEHKLRAEADLEYFINLIHPKRLLGNIHREVIRWWTRQDGKTHQLLLLPRDHGKSAMVAYRVAWELTRDPTLRVLYISSTSNLATKQLKFIKDIFTLDKYRMFWPDMVHKDEGMREKWTEREISLDHPLRKEEAIRDPSIFTAGLTSNIVGMHCDITVLDDVVVQSNAYTDDGREKVRDQYGYLSSIGGTMAKEWVVGTRYHPNDLYSELIGMELESYDETGRVNKRVPLFEVFGDGEANRITVESLGDGSGEFLWPRQQREDGKWFGFDQEVLSVKRGQYLNQTHFRAQYYNDPQDTGSSPFNRSLFQYYEPGYLSCRNGKWFFKNERLNVFASIDFAYSLGKKSDYTAICIVGVDGRNNYYILEIDRFKSDKISEYFNRILKMHEKWGFRKLRAEVSSAQLVIVRDLKENYIKPYGLSLAVEEYRPPLKAGSKEERIMAALEPKYANRQIWHYQGGNCQVLEEELLFRNPAHDDAKDSLASVVDFAVPPISIFSQAKAMMPQFQYHSRFGGVV
jgi:phage terminase large subunit-like protein